MGGLLKDSGDYYIKELGELIIKGFGEYSFNFEEEIKNGAIIDFFEKLGLEEEKDFV